jgi:hypothetical protein
LRTTITKDVHQQTARLLPESTTDAEKPDENRLLGDERETCVCCDLLSAKPYECGTPASLDIHFYLTMTLLKVRKSAINRFVDIYLSLFLSLSAFLFLLFFSLSLVTIASSQDV